MSAWWRRLGTGQRVAVVCVVVVLGLNVVLSAIGSILGGEPGGPASSSFSTGADGLEGYADLLERAGHPVTRLREPVRAADLPADATAVIADPEQLEPSEAKALARFVAGGGRLLVAGRDGAPVVQAVTGTPVEWVLRGDAARLRVWVPAPEVGDARVLVGDQGGRWRNVGPFVPVAGASDEPAVIVGAVGRGSVVAVADAAVLHNQNLARADNARFALAAAGDDRRPVVFVESVHGGVTGWAAVPSSWRWTLLGIAVTGLVAVWAAGVRFGPPEPAARQLRPPRLDHVEALAADLDRVTPPPADLAAALAEGAQAAARERHARGQADPDTVPADPPRAGAQL